MRGEAVSEANWRERRAPAAGVSPAAASATKKQDYL